MSYLDREKAGNTLTLLVQCIKTTNRSIIMVDVLVQLTLILYMAGLLIHHK